MTIARDYGVGLIVMATHGRGGMTRALLGSVATATIRQTGVPIMLVRPDEVEQVPEASPRRRLRPASSRRPRPRRRRPYPWSRWRFHRTSSRL